VHPCTGTEALYRP